MSKVLWICRTNYVWFFLFFFLNQARKHILQIHTRDWNPKLSDPFLGELAEKCVGECFGVSTFTIDAFASV